MLQWQEEACPEVMLDLRAPLEVSPPPHIMQLKSVLPLVTAFILLISYSLLVRLMWILLYRPFFQSSAGLDQSPSVLEAIPTCERAAIEINHIFTMYDRYYPLSRASYIVIFAGFLQATVDLALADREKSVSGPTLSRLALAGRVLSGGSANIPGMHSSVRSLQTHLHATLSRWTRKGSEQLNARATSATSSCLASTRGPSKDSRNISCSPSLSNQRSSATPPDALSDGSTIVSFSMSPISNIPSTHELEDNSVNSLPSHYNMLPHQHTSLSISPRHYSPSEVTPYPNLDILPKESLRPDFQMDSVYQDAPNSYIPQTPDQEVVDYMIGSQLSHYESGCNAWFWPGDGGESAYNVNGSMLQNSHIASV